MLGATPRAQRQRTSFLTCPGGTADRGDTAPPSRAAPARPQTHRSALAGSHSNRCRSRHQPRACRLAGEDPRRALRPSPRCSVPGRTRDRANRYACEDSGALRNRTDGTRSFRRILLKRRDLPIKESLALSAVRTPPLLDRCRPRQRHSRRAPASSPRVSAIAATARRATDSLEAATRSVACDDPVKPSSRRGAPR